LARENRTDTKNLIRAAARDPPETRFYGPISTFLVRSPDMTRNHIPAALGLFTLVIIFQVARGQPALEASLPIPDAPLPPGMTRIFDGKTLDGWVQLPPDSWTVKDGRIASLGVARGVIYTKQSLGRCRIVFDVRHVSGKPDHRAGVLVFCQTPKEGEKPADTLNGIQFQVPFGGTWDYRKGKNNNGKEFFTRLVKPDFDETKWARVELLIDPEKGTGRMAVAQPPGSKAIEVLQFKDPTAGLKGPFALQMHNKGLFDEYANLAIEAEPKTNDLVTTK
jgi:hypothetical protein